MAKTTFHINNYNKPIPKFWLKIATYLKGLFALLAGTAAINGYPWVTVGIMIAGYTCDEAIKLINEEDGKPTEDISNNPA